VAADDQATIFCGCAGVSADKLTWKWEAALPGSENLSLLSEASRQAEFWSAIAGAIVGAVTGGAIAYLVQIKALHEGRKQRDEDRKLIRDAQGRALLIKMGRIISNYHAINRHFEASFERAEQRGFAGEPWQFVVPSTNTPDPVHFTMDELGMLLSLRNNEVFNALVGMDTVHNSFVDAFKLFNAERRALTERLPSPSPTTAEQENVLGGQMPAETFAALRPRMIDVNVLIEQLRDGSKKDFEEATKVIATLVELLHDKLGLSYKVDILHPK